MRRGALAGGTRPPPLLGRSDSNRKSVAYTPTHVRTPSFPIRKAGVPSLVGAAGFRGLPEPAVLPYPRRGGFAALTAASLAALAHTRLASNPSAPTFRASLAGRHGMWSGWANAYRIPVLDPGVCSAGQVLTFKYVSQAGGRCTTFDAGRQVVYGSSIQEPPCARPSPSASPPS